MKVIILGWGYQDSFDSRPGLICQVVPGPDVIPKIYQRQNIGSCHNRKTVLMPALTVAVLPDFGEDCLKCGPFCRREGFPPGIRGTSYPLQCLLDCLVPLDQEAASPQVILGGSGHTFFESIRVPDDKLTCL